MFLSKESYLCGKSGNCPDRLLWLVAQLRAEDGGDGKDHAREDDPGNFFDRAGNPEEMGKRKKRKGR